jgi:hypothetical protein
MLGVGGRMDIFRIWELWETVGAYLTSTGKKRHELESEVLA